VRVDYAALCHTLACDDEGAERVEQQLLVGGERGLAAIEQYFSRCSTGGQQGPWGNNGARLVRLIRRFPGGRADRILRRIINDASGRIWEYETKIVPAAQAELRAVESEPSKWVPDAAPPAEFPPEEFPPEEYPPMAYPPAAPEDRPYTVAEATADLCRVFSKDGPLNRAEVKRIGQKIYDANVPLSGGVGGMHQTYHMFHARLPAFGAMLSQIWDKIGDWRD
jgi:hypothetical protein